MTNPVFKTFYNHRIFLIYQPDAYREYLRRMVERQWPEPDRFALRLGLMAWGTILVYQARMVPFDFNRRLKVLVRDDGSFFNQDPTLPLSRSIYRQQLAMQLGIEVITRSAEVKARIEETPIVAQYTYDTLYMPSFFHERGRGISAPDGITLPFRVTPEDLRDHLWYRAGADSREKRPEALIAPEMRDYLFGVLKRYMALLAQPREIQRETIRYASRLADDERRLWLGLADAIDSRTLVHYSTARTGVPAPQPAAQTGAPPHG